MAPLIAAPTVKSLNVFDGIGEVADGLTGLEPPDPWLAVSSTHVVQSTNGMVRIFNRTGTALVSAPTWALFALDPSEYDADPRILWDAAHARWVGVLLSYQEDYSVNYLNLAISETSDPTGAWDIDSYQYVDGNLDPTFPDYPGIASSTDKIVLTANEYAPDAFGDLTYLGASVLVVRWSDILAGLVPSPTQWTPVDASLFAIRPARLSSSAADVHLIAEDFSSGDVMYAKLTGTAPAVSFVDLTGLTTLPAFCDWQAPRQPDSPATIDDAVDARPTDAVWRSGALAFVSTCLTTSDGGATFDDSVRVVTLNTGTTPPSLVDDELIGGAGVDSYMGGIGFSGDGTLFLSYTESSSSEYPSTFVAARYASNWTGATLVRAGSAAYQGSRWGDYVGVATDPAGTATVWQTNQVTDGGGDWVTNVSRLALDFIAPVVTGPIQGLVAGTTLGGYTVPVKVTWTATETGSGIASTSLQVDQFSVGLFPAGSVSGTSVTRSHYWKASTSSANRSYQYAVTATDGYGNLSTLVAGPRLSPVVYQQTSSAFVYSSGWTTSSSSSYSGGSSRYSRTAGRYVSFKTSGRAFALVSYKASTRGKVKVYVDGVYKGIVTLTSSTSKARNLAWVYNPGSLATHTIKLVVYSGRVDVDAFVVLK